MRALVKQSTRPGDVSLAQRPTPEPGPGQILVRIVAAAVCGSDRSEITGPDAGLTPRVLGHEAAGIVAAIGEGVATDLQVGDRVTMETDAYLCGRCRWCRTEQYQRCPHRLGIGRGADGALADYLAMPAKALHQIPDNVSLLAAALTEPTAVAVHAVLERSPSLTGQVVIVNGPGAVGQLCAQVARAAGATVVMAGLSRHEAKFDQARAAGIAHFVRTDVEDLADYVADVSGGEGAHTVFECSGAAGVLMTLGPALSKGGRIVLVAFYKANPEINVMELVNHEFELVGSRGKTASSFRTALRLMGQGSVSTLPVISTVLPLEQWQQGIEAVGAGDKVVFAIDPETIAAESRDLGTGSAI